MKVPKISIIVLNWNGLELTRACIKSLRKHTNYPNPEYILVDNGSTDGSFKILKKEFPWVKLVRIKYNIGFSGGSNIGFKHAKGAYVFLVSNDVEFTKNWISPMIKIVKSDDRIAGASPRVVLYGEKLKKSKDVFKEVLTVNGSAMFFRKNVIEEIGGLDEKNFYPAFGEENDWCYRAINAGYKIVEVPNSIVFHKGSATTEKEYGSDKKYIMCETHRLKAMLLNLPVKHLVKFIPGLGLIVIKSIVEGRLFLLLKAYKNILTYFGEILEERGKRLSKVR